jgi:glycosyltransferase involved in cell wall biosynthesis
MRVFFPLIGGSGVQVYTRLLAQGLQAFAVETRAQEFSPSWEYFPYGLRWVLRNSSSPPDLIHVNAEYGQFFQTSKKPLLGTLHHSSIDVDYLSSLPAPVRLHHRWFLRSAVQKTLNCANAIVAVSKYTRETISDVFQKEYSIEVIYNGTDTVRFCPQIVEESCRPVDKIILFFSGNLSRRKGADLLEPVMRKLGAEFVLHVTTGLRGTESPFSNATNIRCLGRLKQEELIRELNRADIAFQPSRREGFGLSILEAMACGKPVVSTNGSAIPEIVDHGKGGYLCESGSVDQFVSAIKSLAQSPELRHTMGQHNRRKVLQFFTLEHMAEKYYELYKRMT